MVGRGWGGLAVPTRQSRLNPEGGSPPWTSRSAEGEPDRHLRRPPVAPREVGDEPQVERPRRARRKLAVELSGPVGFTPGLRPALEDGHAAKRLGLESWFQFDPAGDHDVLHADPVREVGRLDAVDERAALDGDLV